MCFYGSDRGAKIINVEIKGSSSSSVGGCVLMKGVPRIATANDTVESIPYAFNSVELNDEGHLTYDVSLTADDIFQITSQNEIPVEKWVHVAISQNYNEMQLFVDGIEDTKEELPEELVTFISTDSSVVTKSFESKHGGGKEEDNYQVVRYVDLILFAIIMIMFFTKILHYFQLSWS